MLSILANEDVIQLHNTFVMPRAFLIILIFLPLASANGLYTSYETIPANHLEQVVFDLSNAKRQEASAHTLIYDEQLALSARQHAHEMAQLNYMSHESPIAENSTLLKRVIRAGSVAQEIGENVAKLRGVNDVAGHVVQSWYNSPGHRRNLLNPDFTHMGIGVAQDNNGTFYIAQTLARQPLVLQNSLVDSQFLNVQEANIEFSVKARSEVAFFYEDKNTEPSILDKGRYSQVITLNNHNPIQVALGIRSYGNDFIFQDDGWLDPTNAYQQWRAGTSGQKTQAQIENIFVQAKQERNHRVTLYFDKVPNVDYGIWVNNALQEGARFNGNTISVNVPSHLTNPLIELALYKGNNRYSSIIRLILSVRGARVVLEPAPR